MNSKIPEVDATANFMEVGYHLIGEPLNLTTHGQEWFKRVLDSYPVRNDQPSILLGSVAWMAELLSRRASEVNIVDSNDSTLRSIRKALGNAGTARVNLIEATWTDFLPDTREAGLVLGDNSFTYLEFPGRWVKLLDTLANSLDKDGLVALRCFSVPRGHKASSCEEIAGMYLDNESVNYTAVRARLLFSQWDSATYRIDTEAALRTFIDNKQHFDVLLSRANGTENDLQTIVKYRNTNAIYWAPPVEKILEILERRFRIMDVHYGPYELSGYFPLFIARKK